MQVTLNDKKITRWQNKKRWIEEAVASFGQPEAQNQFWELSYQLAEVIWRVSIKNSFFPPIKPGEWIKLFKNDPRDSWVLPYALKSVRKVAGSCGISNPEFFQFLDEQLMITAQSKASDTTFLFGAPAITYTNCTNYYVPGGMIEMVHTLSNYIETYNGVIKTKEPVVNIDKDGDLFNVYTRKKTGESTLYKSRNVISNLPVWNMEDITHGDMAEYFGKESAKYQKAWGAFTMNVAFRDRLDKAIPLHHQIHLTKEDKTEGLFFDSIFVSLSHPDDPVRSPDGMRTMNISTHTIPDWWFNLNGRYDEVKQNVQEQILKVVVKSLNGLNEYDIDIEYSSTPVTWNNWVYRKKGRVGGIPQNIDHSLLDWTPAETPFKGMFMVGDTVFPGQGIPGVTLSGINVYYRISKTFNSNKIL